MGKLRLSKIKSPAQAPLSMRAQSTASVLCGGLGQCCGFHGELPAPPSYVHNDDPSFSIQRGYQSPHVHTTKAAPAPQLPAVCSPLCVLYPHFPSGLCVPHLLEGGSPSSASLQVTAVLLS